MPTIGKILKSRIKQMGFTQSEFADECEISLSALKKYITDELPYSIALLEKFSEKLNCSTDYLLARSETPMQELHSLKEMTHLSDAALLELEMENSDFCREIKSEEDELKRQVAENALVTISLILEDDELVDLIQKLLYFDDSDAYFGDNHLVESPFVTIGGIVLKPHQITGMLTMNIIKHLVNMREDFSRIKDKSAVLTMEVSEDVKECARKWINS